MTRIGSTFSGYGGLDLGVQQVFGGDVVWHCEVDAGASAILAHRHPDVPNLGDVTAVDWAQVPAVDVLTGGFPCQDISDAGLKAGIEGARSGLWAEITRAVSVLRPELVVVENVRALLGRGMGRVTGDLSALGYDATWGTVRASDAGAAHRRARVFLVATPSDADVGDSDWRRVASDQRAQGSTVGLLAAAADTGSDGFRRRDERDLRPVESRLATSPGDNTDRRDQVAADTAGARLERPRSQPARGRSERGGEAEGSSWGVYEPAIRRWSAVLGRPAPPPTEPARSGLPRLSPAFVEWHMGLPAGWVTDVPIGRKAQLRALGNGVVPQQAALALSLLLPQAAAA